MNSGAFSSTLGVYDMYASKLTNAVIKVVIMAVSGRKPSGPRPTQDVASGEVELEMKAMFAEESIPWLSVENTMGTPGLESLFVERQSIPRHTMPIFRVVSMCGQTQPNFPIIGSHIF